MRSKALAKRLKNPEPITTPSRDHHSLISRNPGRRTGSASLLTHAWHHRWTVLGAPPGALPSSVAALHGESSQPKQRLIDHLIRQARAQIAEIAA